MGGRVEVVRWMMARALCRCEAPFARQRARPRTLLATPTMAQHSRHSSALSGATYRSYASLVLVAAWVVMAAALVGGTAAARNPVENVHLAMTGNITQMVVSWKTANNASSVVQYGFSSGKYTFTASGSSDSYDSKSGFNHNVVLLGLSPATVYYYVCGDPSGSMSSEFNFTTPQPTFRPFRVAVYGDLGTDHSQDTINCLNGLAATDSVDFYWHLGDIRYRSNVRASACEPTR